MAGVISFELGDDVLDRIAEKVAAKLAALRPAEPKPDRLTVKQAAEMLHCSERHLRRLIGAKKKRIRADKITHGGSSRLLIPRTEIERLLTEGTT